MVLLRMAAAPQIVDLQTMLSLGAGATAAPSARPTANSANAPMHSPAARPATAPAPVAAARPAPPKPDEGLHLPPQERWFELVQKVRGMDALLAAKVEPLLMTGIKDKLIQLSIPHKVAFLREQLSDSELQLKLKKMIDQFWGPGYSLEITMSTAANAHQGTSATAVAQEKQRKQEEDMAQQVSEHPKVKSAAAAFRGQIKSIQSTSKGGNSK